MASSMINQKDSASHWNYDVFLSFRGEDTRRSFTDHLYAALVEKGVRTFRDDEELERGKEIAPELLKAIEESRISVVVFSKNYARSGWCMDELVKIIECMKAKGQTVLPVFYDVDPTHVRKQTGSFMEAFASHGEDTEVIERAKRWRAALTQAANLSGWHLQNGYESKLIKKIIEEILSKLSRKLLYVDKHLVGVSSRLKEILLRVSIESNDVRMVGICGIGGVGKTTIAKVVYNLISSQFEGISFLANIREVSKNCGLLPLQKQLLGDILMGWSQRISNLDEGINVLMDRLHSKKVLIILDDVDDLNQLESLAGNVDWFGIGSRIVITTRDKHLLNVHGVSEIYEAKELEPEEALQLFSQYAFKRKSPDKDYMNLSDNVVHYAKGLPLALKVLGSFLFSKTILEWESELHKLKKELNTKVQDVLRISFDGLDFTQKEIFLDLACFFKGQEYDFVIKILDGCGFHAKSGIRVLSDRCLIDLLDNRLWMHDLIQQMGWEIVRQECPKDPGKWSRLWDYEHIYSVLKKNTGTETIEGIFLDMYRSKEIHFTTEAFAKMNRLRLLKVSNFLGIGKEGYKEPLSVSFEFPSYELRYLYWHGYPFGSLPSKFHSENLIELNMCYSYMRELWKGNEVLDNLNTIELSNSQHLIHLPNFSSMPNLERLVLEGCTSFLEVDPSIEVLNKLIFLNLKNCKKLRSFPRSIKLECLKYLSLSGCSDLKNFPEIQGNMQHLSELYLDGTAISELPFSIGYLTGLILLDLENCKRLKSLPSSICKLKSLETLILSACSKLESFPEIMENMEHLKKLLLDGTALKQLHPSIEHLNGLVSLNLRDCKNLANLPCSIGNLKSLETLIVSGCSKLQQLPENLGSLQCLVKLQADGTLVRQPPSSIVLLRNLEILSFGGCKGLASNSWSSLFSFWLLPRKSSDTIGLQLPSLSGLCSLRELDISDCNLMEGAVPFDICNLSSLETLNLSRNNFFSLPAGISKLSKLRFLSLNHCKSLLQIPELPSSIIEVNAQYCSSLNTILTPSSVCNNQPVCRWLVFTLPNCFNLDAENPCSNDMAIISPRMQIVTNMLQKLQNFLPDFGFSIFLPGSEIPDWISNQNLGSEVTIELPPHWFESNFLGFAVCCVFAFEDIAPNGCSSQLLCQLQSDESHFRGIGHILHSIDCEGNSEDRLKSHHMWLAYKPRGRLRISYGDCPNRWRHAKASFGFISCCPSNMVRKCGIHLIYAQDHEERNSTMIHHSSSGNFSDLKSADSSVGASGSGLCCSVVHSSNWWGY